jgi:hypothetical protein
VPVVAETEVDDIQYFGELRCVSHGCRFQVGPLNWHRVHRCRNMLEQRTGEPDEVAGTITSRSHSLVHLVDVDAIPFEIGTGERAQDRPWCSAAR